MPSLQHPQSRHLACQTGRPAVRYACSPAHGANGSSIRPGSPKPVTGALLGTQGHRWGRRACGWGRRGISLELKNTKLQPSQSCLQCQGTLGKLEDGGKCPQSETPSCSLPRASHQSPGLDVVGDIPILPPRIPASHVTGAPAQLWGHPRGHRAPGEGRAAGSEWGSPAPAKYRKESDASSVLWSCRERELKVKPSSWLHAGISGVESSCHVSASQTPGLLSPQLLRPPLSLPPVFTPGWDAGGRGAGGLRLSPQQPSQHNPSTPPSRFHVRAAAGKPPAGRAGWARPVPPHLSKQSILGLGNFFFLEEKLLPARPQVPGKLSPRCTELLPYGTQPAWMRG
ncbi:uncharacterized protein VSU04_011527 isoform 1-T2 [Chlamydotis macqueenii]